MGYSCILCIKKEKNQIEKTIKIEAHKPQLSNSSLTDGWSRGGGGGGGDDGWRKAEPGSGVGCVWLMWSFIFSFYYYFYFKTVLISKLIGETRVKQLKKRQKRKQQTRN